MVLPPKISKRWSGRAIVAASGESLTQAQLDMCRGEHVLVVNDAYRLAPWAEVLYACDPHWWTAHQEGVKKFTGEKWSSHQRRVNDKELCAQKHGLMLCRGDDGDGFSMDGEKIHYGGNSGFQGINLTMAFLGFSGLVALIGFDMKGKHFFGDHPPQLITKDPSRFIPAFRKAVRRGYPGIDIVNCTPGSALDCFPFMRIEDALQTSNDLVA